MGGVTVQDWAVAVADLPGVVEDDHLGGEVRHTSGGLVLAVGGHVASLDVLHGDVLDVETNVVSGHGLGQRLVVHLHRLDLSGQLVGGEGDDHAGLDDAGLNTAHGHCSNTSDFVNILGMRQHKELIQEIVKSQQVRFMNNQQSWVVLKYNQTRKM